MTHTYPPVQIEIMNPKFPYSISDKNTDPTSYVSIGLSNPFEADLFGLDHSILFYIAGAELTSLGFAQNDVEEHQIILRQSSDHALERTQLAVFTFMNLQLAPSFRKTLSLNGWLTSAQFRPAGYEDDQEQRNLLTDMEQQGGVPSEGRQSSASLPHISFSGLLGYPLEVSIGIHHNQRDVQKLLSELAGR
jgi:hypothetical protein